ncbi:hypothetical protein OXB_0863 [Bacillus sp. OxB-1]|uniref:hypothetical protein n=1 Tax=Bacillus sp. (strain OxB-1) TaxID=98228 RepID=UPI000581EE91|nr:hypothetical protein [Bacillus sp. OxB-1]BAQ09335.1 hypothetical protein OXB_0863 [Bacillus sp. OxB-1]
MKRFFIPLNVLKQMVLRFFVEWEVDTDVREAAFYFPNWKELWGAIISAIAITLPSVMTVLVVGVVMY